MRLNTKDILMVTGFASSVGQQAHETGESNGNIATYLWCQHVHWEGKDTVLFKAKQLAWIAHNSNEHFQGSNRFLWPLSYYFCSLCPYKQKTFCWRLWLPHKCNTVPSFKHSNFIHTCHSPRNRPMTSVNQLSVFDTSHYVVFIRIATVSGGTVLAFSHAPASWYHFDHFICLCPFNYNLLPNVNCIFLWRL